MIPNKQVYGFDSFEGLPEEWVPSRPKGHFATDGNLPKVNDNVILLKGFFDSSLPDFKNTDYYQSKDSIAFLHIDCDLYSSTLTVLNELKDKIKPGTIILFDEYFNYTGWQHHEYKAFQEFMKDFDHDYEYECYHNMFTQVGVKIVQKRCF